MNYSWTSPSGNSESCSPGFVYYDIEPSNGNSSNSIDTSDFISFNSRSNSPYGKPMFNQFSPQNYSSPSQPFYRRGRLKGGSQYSPKGNWKNNWRHNRNTKNFITTPTDVNNSTYMSKYYDPTCMENPWLELEQQVPQSQINDSTSSAML
ncbi:hypothetical protein ABEB36_008729 [Hypothenemus hampei]|uniref:Uncharacterized protein n=1 Tax=Hypothenemus hampei TaxID=57062 RepID=A0ABD1ENA9_HYPHA